MRRQWKNSIFGVLLLFFALLTAESRAQESWIVEVPQSSRDFPVVTNGKGTAILMDAEEDELVKRVAGLWQQDVERVSGVSLKVKKETDNPEKELMIIVGSLDHSEIIQKMAEKGKIDCSDLEGQWEAFKIQLVSNPVDGVERALVIAGSDRRGTAYGLLELSKEMGVSPWYWWADVPVKKKNGIFVKEGIALSEKPSVKYRGIFLNDEAPALSGWAYEKFGGFNHQFYEKVFELLLRLKANFLWPAMWGNAFNNDDSLNAVKAQEYGIVMGNSHQEPMNQATAEWRRIDRGDWDYETNAEVLRAFWRQGIEQMKGKETIVTMGMRGNGDKPMSDSTNIALLEKIVHDQRGIIEEVTEKPAAETPQVWALYKEVQEYYDQGMEVPKDITLLYSDDNWGNLRRLPDPEEPKRKGGYGIYYHFDYVGGPRNYKWLNTNNIARVWEQMNLAYTYGVDRIWIVNVGDLKPMEFPISFFLDQAWNAEKWNAKNLKRYFTEWTAGQFGKEHAEEIGALIQHYSQYNARRKPELLDQHTYSLLNYDEVNTVTGEWDHLLKKAKELEKRLSEEYQNAYYQLVLHPIEACANLQHLYTAVAWNHHYAEKKDSRANGYAAQAKQYFEEDSLISKKYNELNDGKWNHFMDQTHIGYTYWQQPPVNKMPEVYEVEEGQNLSLEEPAASEDISFKEEKGAVFFQKEGYVSLEASNFTRKIDGEEIYWQIIPGIGKTGDGVTTYPLRPGTTEKLRPVLEYDFYSKDTGEVKVTGYFSPTLNFQNLEEGLQYGISIDEAEPQIVSLNERDKEMGVWSSWVANNINKSTTEHRIKGEGKHTLKYWYVDPAIVTQKFVIDLGGLKESYLGPRRPDLRNEQLDKE